MIKPILLDFPMPIITPRLIIRPPKIGDGSLLNEAILESFDTLHQTMAWAREKPTLQESEEIVRQAEANWILKNNDEPYLMLFMFDKMSNIFVGATGYHHYDWEVPSIETGYWIRKSKAGKGLMTEAIHALTKYAFKEMLMKRITITCDVDNISSKKIPERLGYTLEGVLKNNRRNHITNEPSDTLIYSRYNLDGLDDLHVTWEDK